MVRNYTTAQLLEKVREIEGFKGYPQEYWLLGVRSNEDIANRFDDKFYLFLGEQFILVTSGTTNPGTPVLENYEKFNKAGAAVLNADKWYYNVWHYGKHQGKVEALLQLGAEVEVYRDADKDDNSEEQGVLQKGYFGINFHPNTYNLNKASGTAINGWSAGCQVVNDVNTYKRIITMCKPQKKVSYCLINEFN
jgi:hypothetical protein